MTAQSTEGAMPPLPEPEVWCPVRERRAHYTEYQMHAYAAPLLARVAKLQAERDAANKLLKTALQPLELYNAYGWSDRAGVRASIKEHLAALAAHKEQP